jgi:site-specific DNA recombinase
VPRRPYSVSKEGGQRITIPVPPLVSVELFAQAAEQLAENRRRARSRRQGARYLLQGLVLCQHCGYAYCGMGRSHRTAAGQRHHYDYYRCVGRQRMGEEGHKICRARQVRADHLEAAVWDDVCALLAEPARVEQEYQRRLQGSPAGAGGGEGAALAKRAAGVRKAISRLIDGYSEGLLEKEEFEPRLRAARERLARLEAEARAQADAEARRAELRLVIGKLQEFAEGIKSGLGQADWATRREVIRALVKQIEIGEEDIQIVYRVPPVPFEEGPDGGFLQDCRRGREPFRSPRSIREGKFDSSIPQEVRR